MTDRALSGPAERALRRPSVAMVAGETSGDLLAGLLLQGMRARWPNMVRQKCCHAINSFTVRPCGAQILRDKIEAFV